MLNTQVEVRKPTFLLWILLVTTILLTNCSTPNQPTAPSNNKIMLVETTDTNLAPNTSSVRVANFQSLTEIGKEVSFNIKGQLLQGRITNIDQMAELKRWDGEINNGESSFTFTQKNGELIGEINLSDKNFHLEGANETSSLQELPYQESKTCGVEIPKRNTTVNPQNNNTRIATNRERPKQYLPITVGVFWTKAARLGSNGNKEEGSQQEIARQLGRMGWNAANAFYGASVEPGSPYKIRLDYTLVQEVNYEESGDDVTDLVRLRDRLNDGFLDEIPRIREERKFDIAILVVENLDTGGLARVMSEDNKDDFASQAFAVVERDSGYSNFNFGHEIGHLFGCGHGIDDTGMFNYSAGWHFTRGNTKFHTIMAYRKYAGERAMNAFSNPRSGNGDTGKEGEADHAKTIQQTMQIIAGLK